MTPTFLFLDQTSLPTLDYLIDISLNLLDFFTLLLLLVEASAPSPTIKRKKKIHWSTNPPLPQGVPLLGSKFFTEVIKLKRGHDGVDPNPVWPVPSW